MLPEPLLIVPELLLIPPDEQLMVPAVLLTGRPGK